MAESPSASEQNPDSAESQRTGGVNIGADQANIGGDVVGRDQTTTIDTGGGVYVGRDVTIEGQGKLIGRDDNSINVSGSPGAIVGRDVTVIRQGHVGKRFWMTVALIAGMIVIGLGVAGAALTQLPPMPDGFNIAIAEFVEQDANGRLTVTDESQKLSNWLFDSIQKETDQFDLGLRVNWRAA